MRGFRLYEALADCLLNFLLRASFCCSSNKDTFYRPLLDKHVLLGAGIVGDRMLTAQVVLVVSNEAPSADIGVHCAYMENLVVLVHSVGHCGRVPDLHALSADRVFCSTQAIFQH